MRNLRDGRFFPIDRPGLIGVEAAWARVLALGQRLESARQARQELIDAVKEATNLEEETGIRW
jgi:hypothetical protein